MTDPVKIIVGEGDITEVNVPEYNLIQTGGGGGGGSDGATFFPEVSEEGVISWTNDGGYDNPEPVNIKGPAGNDGSDGEDGEDGTTFTPAVDASGNLSWTNDGGKQNPPTVNIKGPQGEDAPDDYILIQTTQPTSETNCIWVDPSNEDEVVLATASDLNTAVSGLNAAIGQKQDAPAAAGTAGQVLGLNSQLAPVWVNQSGGGGDVTRQEFDALEGRVDDLEDDTSDLKSAFDDTQDWLGYDINYIDGRRFTSSNSTNWTINSANKDSISITHNNTFSTGSPRISLENVLKPSTMYKFNGTFSDTTYRAIALYVDGSYVNGLFDGDTFTTPASFTTIMLMYAPVVAGTFSITGMRLVKNTLNGVVQQIQTDIDEICADNADVETRVQTLENTVGDITSSVYTDITGTETQNKCITANGTVSAAGSNNYKVAKYPVTPLKKYVINASANWGNRLFAYYDSSDVLVELGTKAEDGSTFTELEGGETTAPAGASCILVGYNDLSLKASCKEEAGKKIKGKWSEKKWVCVGDSLTEENARTSKHYFDYVAEKTGITVHNMGVSGSGYARLSGENKAFYQRVSSCPTDADVVTIFGSFNDLGAELPVGSVDDTGVDTLAGCVNTTISNLQATIPLVNLGIVAPTPWDTTQPATSGQAYNYVEMLKAICKRRSIPFLDLWRESNLRPWDADFRAVAYSHDGGSGTHPDENGHKLIAPHFKAFLETLLM